MLILWSQDGRGDGMSYKRFCDKCRKELTDVPYVQVAPVGHWGDDAELIKALEEDEFDLCKECYSLVKDFIRLEGAEILVPTKK